MTRNYLLALAVVVAALLGWWLVQHSPPLPPSATPEQVSSDMASAPAPEVVDIERQEVVGQSPALESSSPGPGVGPGPGRGTTGPEGLTGVVVELGGATVPDVLLELVDRSGTSIATTSSDADGNFAFEETAPRGSALIAQTANGTGPKTRHRRIGDHRGGKVTIWVPPSATIEGVVVDARGRPVQGADVTTDRFAMLLNMPSWEHLEGPEYSFVFSVETDAAGRFHLPSTLRGTHFLRATYGDQDASVRCQAGDQAVRLTLGTHLGGRVSLEGQLRERGSGVPVVGAQVFVEHVEGGSSIGIASKTTDKEGRYLVEGLKLGRYRVRVVAEAYAPTETSAPEFEEGRHRVDLTLDSARELLVKVVDSNGQPLPGAEIQIFDAGENRIEVPSSLGFLVDSVRVDASGEARLKRLPATTLTLLAVRGDLLPAGRAAIDLRSGSPESLTIECPNTSGGLNRRHFFRLRDTEGGPVEFEGVVIAECFDAGGLVSRVEGRWKGGQFVFGHDGQLSFDDSTIAVGASAESCRVEISVPGYAKATLTLEAGTASPTTVRFVR